MCSIVNWHFVPLNIMFFIFHHVIHFQFFSKLVVMMMVWCLLYWHKNIRLLCLNSEFIYLGLHAILTYHISVPHLTCNNVGKKTCLFSWNTAPLLAFDKKSTFSIYLWNLDKWGEFLIGRLFQKKIFILGFYTSCRKHKFYIYREVKWFSF